MNEVDVFFLPAMVGEKFRSHGEDEESIRGSSLVVVIDVLRATTTIVKALEEGAREIIPVATVEEARIMVDRMDRDALLGGERGGLPYRGFDLGNSPREYTAKEVSDRTIVFTTTNGTRALMRVKNYSRILAAAFTNMEAVVEYISSAGDDYSHLFVLCAGTQGEFSLEDACCAGMIVERLLAEVNSRLDLSDAACAARAIYSTYHEDLQRMMHRAQGGKNLIEVGLRRDLTDASFLDISRVVPVYHRGRITHCSVLQN